MPVLSNPKHELFAQEVAKGTPLEKAYAVAGYKPDRKNAQRLTTKDDVRSRIDEILTQAAVKAGVSVERIVDELRDVAFASITDAVEWGEAIAVKNKRGAIQVVQAVVFKPSADLPPRVTAAISEVRKTKDGAPARRQRRLAHQGQAGLASRRRTSTTEYSRRRAKTGPP